MRSLRLARVAADAEMLLLRRRVAGVQKRVIFGAVAAVFGVALLATLHALGYVALTQFAQLSRFVAVSIVAGVDLAFAALFGILASVTIKDSVAEEAIQLRDTSLAQMKTGFATTAMLLPAGRLLGRKHIYALVLAGLTARFLGSR
jgi:hypothetical protein